MKTLAQLEDFVDLCRAYRMARENMTYRAIDAFHYVQGPDTARNMAQFTCGHEWVINEESGRCYCLLCGADGDA
jgi:hypothetical protein